MQYLVVCVQATQVMQAGNKIPKTMSHRVKIAVIVRSLFVKYVSHLGDSRHITYQGTKIRQYLVASHRIHCKIFCKILFWVKFPACRISSTFEPYKATNRLHTCLNQNAKSFMHCIMRSMSVWNLELVSHQCSPLSIWLLVTARLPQVKLTMVV